MFGPVLCLTYTKAHIQLNIPIHTLTFSDGTAFIINVKRSYYLHRKNVLATTGTYVYTNYIAQIEGSTLFNPTGLGTTLK